MEPLKAAELDRTTMPAPGARAAPVARSLWSAGATVFLASGCTMVLELVAARILAPRLGVSLYTWTSTLAVVLAGIGLGSYLGGRLADRRSDPTTLGLVLFGGSLATLGILAGAAVLLRDPLPPQIPLIPGIVLVNVALFLLPCLILGMVPPLAIKQTLARLDRAGATVGTLYAWSTAGAIVATFATGFVLMELLGTRALVLATAAALFLLGVLAGEFWRDAHRLARAGALGLTVAAGLFVLRGPLLTSPCLRETSYFCIRVVEFERDLDRGPQLALVLDHLVHSRVWPLDPTQLGYSYIRAYADATAVKARDKPDFKALVIGGGGYALPRYLEVVYPRSEVHVIEIDPWVTEISHQHLGLQRGTRIRTHHDDARAFLLRWHDAPTFDLIYGDAFNDLAMPYHLTTVEFIRLLDARLADDGVYLANVIDSYEDGQVLRAFVHTLGEVFLHVYLLRWGPRQPGSLETLVVAGAKRPLDLSAFGDDPATAHDRRAVRTTVIAGDELAAFLRAGPKLVLTDDYAPLEQLTARLFLRRGS